MTKPSEARCENLVTNYDELVVCDAEATYLVRVPNKGLVHWCSMCWVQENWAVDKAWKLEPLGLARKEAEDDHD